MTALLSTKVERREYQLPGHEAEITKSPCPTNTVVIVITIIDAQIRMVALLQKPHVRSSHPALKVARE